MGEAGQGNKVLHYLNSWQNSVSFFLLQSLTPPGEEGASLFRRALKSDLNSGASSGNTSWVRKTVTEQCAGLCPNMVSNRWHHHSFPHGIKCPQKFRTKISKSSVQPSQFSWRHLKWWQSWTLCNYCNRMTLFIPSFPASGVERHSCYSVVLPHYWGFNWKSLSKFTEELELWQ